MEQLLCEDNARSQTSWTCRYGEPSVTGVVANSVMERLHRSHLHPFALRSEGSPLDALDSLNFIVRNEQVLLTVCANARRVIGSVFAPACRRCFGLNFLRVRRRCAALVFYHEDGTSCFGKVGNVLRLPGAQFVGRSGTAPLCWFPATSSASLLQNDRKAPFRYLNRTSAAGYNA